MDTKTINANLAWTAAWNKAILEGKKPCEAIVLAAIAKSAALLED